MNTEKDELDLEFDRISKAIAAGDEVTLLAMDYMAALERPVPARIHRKWVEFAFKTASECGELRGVVARLRSEIAALRESREIADGRAVGTITNLVEEINRLRTDLAALRGRVESSLYNIDMLRDEGFTTKQIYGLRGMLDVILTGESRGLNGEENAHG